MLTSDILEQAYRQNHRTRTREDLLSIPLDAPLKLVKLVADKGHNLPPVDFDVLGKKAWEMEVYLGGFRSTMRGAWKPELNTWWNRFRFALHTFLIRHRIVI